MTPFMTHEEFDSPGCTLAEMKTPFLFKAFSDLGSLSFDVIVIRSHLFPANVLVRIVRWK